MDVNEYALWQHVSHCIRQAREAKGVTQDQLAFAIGLSRTSMTNAEAGRQRIPLGVIYKVCKTLDISLDDMLPPIDDIVSGAPVYDVLVDQRIAELEDELNKLREKRRR